MAVRARLLEQHRTIFQIALGKRWALEFIFPAIDGLKFGLRCFVEDSPFRLKNRLDAFVSKGEQLPNLSRRQIASIYFVLVDSIDQFHRIRLPTAERIQCQTSIAIFQSAEATDELFAGFWIVEARQGSDGSVGDGTISQQFVKRLDSFNVLGLSQRLDRIFPCDGI